MCEKSPLHGKIRNSVERNAEDDYREESNGTEGADRCKREMCVKDVGVRLTAAVLIGAVRAVRLFITLITCRDAGAITQAFKLLRSTPVTGALGGCKHLAQL